jgi:hypothetical protein
LQSQLCCIGELWVSTNSTTHTPIFSIDKGVTWQVNDHTFGSGGAAFLAGNGQRLLLGDTTGGYVYYSDACGLGWTP